MSKVILIRITIVTVALGLGFGRSGIRQIYGVFVDKSAAPVCHKSLDYYLHNWQDTHKTREFPNVRGASAASMAELDIRDDLPELKTHYSYVPGLTKDDPGDLVLMYVNQPTRWTWHGEPPTVFTEKAWILVPVDMKFYGNRDKLGPGEFSERVSFDEFRLRLEKTLDFLKLQKRSNWEAVVKEHSEFLRRIQTAPQP